MVYGLGGLGFRVSGLRVQGLGLGVGEVLGLGWILPPAQS